MKFLKQMVVFFVVLILLSMAVGCGNKRISDFYATDDRNEMAGDSYTAEAGNGVVDKELEDKVAEHYEENHANSYDDDEEYSEDDYDYEGEENDEDATADASNANEDKAENIESKADDPYSCFVVSEEWASANGAAVVEHDGKLYSIGGFLPEDTVKKYGFGCYNQAPGLVDMAYLYVTDIIKSPSDPLVTNRMDLISLGDFPIIKVRRGEVARVYNSYSVPNSIDLVPTEMIGYTIRAFLRSGGAGYLPVLDDTLAGNQMYGDNIGVFDMSDNQVADVRNLVYNQDYKYEYYNGTEYHEIIMPANCSAYKYYDDEDDFDVISLPVELTKNGYVEFSFDVAPGIYYMDATSLAYSVIEVE